MTVVSLPEQTACDGCTKCRHRCTSGIPLTYDEYTALRKHVESLPEETASRVLGPPPRVPWPGAEDGETYEACRFQNAATGLCEAYPARPLICRLFGHVEWLPCPTGTITTAWPQSVETMRLRSGETRKTWEEWDAEERAGS